MGTSFLKYLIGSLLLLTFYQNCSGRHETASSLSAFEACNIGLKEEFSKTYHSFLKTNCASCHFTGGTGNGAFGDNDLDIAFDAFNVRGYKLIDDRAVDPNHQSPFTGPHHQESIQDFETSWLTAKDQADLCIANSGINVDPNIDGGVIDEDEVITEGTIELFAKKTEPDKDKRTITWNLENEIREPRELSLPGATFSIDLESTTTISGEKSYSFSNPVFKAGDSPIDFSHISIKINGQLMENASSYFKVRRKIPANSTRNLNAGGLVVGYNVRSTDVFSIMIGRMDAIPSFDPPTFQELATAGGVFAASCVSCHQGATPSGGLDMTDYEGIIYQNMVSAYNPNNSEIFKRMNDSSNPMPQAGLLPQTRIDEVQQWIEDGATECGYNNNGGVITNCP